ncbi:aminopeptidase [Halococcus hamelinensis]|nr:aminopeptidase [Halococcus hamelinensis]
MDPRTQEHAKILVEHSAEVKSGDNVMIMAPPVAEDLVVALYDQFGKHGANPATQLSSTPARRAFLRASDPKDLEVAEHKLAGFEKADIVINIMGSKNTHETNDVGSEKNAAYRTAMQPLQEEIMGKRWVFTQYPASGNAQEAEMSTEAYEDFVHHAVNKDWKAQKEFQSQLVEILDPASDLRVRSGDTSDIRMSIDGMQPVNCAGDNELPDGEVYTAPVLGSVEGEVLFDKPLITRGREIQDIHLRFENGEVVEHCAEKNEKLLTSILDTDDGARRLGEVGIGMNRDIDQFTYNMLFDEKMGDTVHMALGRAYEESVGPKREQNESAIHLDMIVDMAENSVIEVDGEVIQRNGRFVFEDGFTN